MLGKLARWLALMGYDAEYPREPAADRDLVDRAVREGRVFLTRDRLIPPVKGARRVVLSDARLEVQLRQVFQELGLKPDPEKWFTRCGECNVALETLPLEEGRRLAPPLARERATYYRRCPKCARLYWDGTHVERTREKLADWGFGQSPEGAGGSGLTP